MFTSGTLRRSTTIALLSCGFLAGSASVIGISTFLASQNQAKADDRTDDERYWERYKEHHFEIFEAARNLREARGHLDGAAHDYHGHRTAALKLVADAQRELHLAIEAER